jgi:Tripartite tricarboxylate transporter family receptor
MLGVTSLNRSTLLPDVPTIAEQGLPGYEAVLRYGLVVPAHTPRPMIDLLNSCGQLSRQMTFVAGLPPSVRSRWRQRLKNTPQILIAKKPSGRRLSKRSD